MGRIDGRLIRRGALILLFLGGGLLFAACATPPGQPGRGPVASFDASPTSGNSPLPVTFTDHSTGTITGWQWDFGDTTTSTTQSPTHTYDAGGTYTVALTVNGAGGSNTTSKTITVNARPVVSITAPPDGTTSAPDLPVTFTGSATDPEDGNLAAGIQWSSSIDGALGSGASLTTSGLSSGTHTITAAVTDSAGATGTATITVVVNAPPSIGITSPETGATYSPDNAITFTGSATDLEDGVLSSSIQWSSSKDGPLGTGASITSSLTSGAHTITASVTDSGGKTATRSVSITVNAAPSVSITAPTNGALFQLGDAVPLTGTASDLEDGDLAAAIQWSSSQDGSLGSGASINPSSLSAGSHVITASVTDTGGKTATTSVSITVNAPPDVAITGPQTGALYQSGSQVTLTGTASDPEDGDLAAAIQWSSSRDGSLGTGASINASSLSVGSHVITASVTDSQGGTDSTSIAVTVTAPVPPQASFSLSPTTGTAPLLVSLTDTSTGDITSWAWTFTSGTGGSIGPNVTHTFPTPGTYIATLTVSGPGGSSSAVRAIVVTSAPPQASFTATPFTGIAPLTVSFTDHSTGSITSWTWSFSDGGSASGQNVNHTFTTPGTYTATLSVAGPDGTSQFQRTIVASSLPPGDPGGGRDPVDPPGGGRDPGDPGKIPG